MNIDKPIKLVIDTEFTVSKTKKVINGTPYIEYGGLTPLYNGDVNCVHEIIGGDNYSGIKCKKCNGWYCA